MVNYWIETIFFMIAALGALLLGIDILSSNVTKLAHTGLKKLFNKTSKNVFLGVGIGAIATALMQSSAATTIMVVGFVNTGVMNLAQATAIIMGANIGTTVTAQLASLGSFSFSAYAIGFCGIGVFINMLAKKDRTKTLGMILAGFGLLFLGLECMSMAIHSKYEGVELVRETIGNVLQSINGPGSFIILFILGIVITALVQSSALITTIVITLTASGIYIGAGDAGHLTNNVLFLILGTNIGTCVTAMISSIGATSNARRASVIHLLFNLTGAIIFMIILLVFPNLMENTFVKWFGEPATQIAMFHTFFNVLCTLLFIPFVNLIVKISMFLVKDKDDNTNITALLYADERMIQFPSIAIHQVRKELLGMYKKAVDILNLSLDGFFNKDTSLKEQIDKDNQYLDDMSRLVVEYIVKVTSQKLTVDDECTISAFHRVINDILRIGEIGDNIGKYTRQVEEQELVFSENVIVELGLLRNTINALYEKTDEIFITKDISKLADADKIEDSIDNMRKALIDDHFDRLNKGECKPQNSGVFVNLVNNLERAADHMTYIAHSVEDAAIEANKLK